MNAAVLEPSRPLQAEMRAAEVTVFHLAVAERSVWPTLPFGYAGAVAFCAVDAPEAAMRPVLVPLVAIAPKMCDMDEADALEET